MGIFNEKQSKSTENAQIGEDLPNGDIVWTDCDFEWAWCQYQGGVLELRGSITVNGIHYMRFYLPPPPHMRIYEA